MKKLEGTRGIDEFNLEILWQKKMFIICFFIKCNTTQFAPIKNVYNYNNTKINKIIFFPGSIMSLLAFSNFCLRLNFVYMYLNTNIVNYNLKK